MIKENEAWALLAEALAEHPHVTVADLQAELGGGNAFLWLGRHSAVFTRINDGVCEMGPVGGDVAEMLKEALPRIEAFARETGCSEMFVQAGRQAWSRALRPYGYEEAAVILRKRLGSLQ